MCLTEGEHLCSPVECDFTNRSHYECTKEHDNEVLAIFTVGKKEKESSGSVHCS